MSPFVYLETKPDLGWEKQSLKTKNLKTCDTTKDKYFKLLGDPHMGSRNILGAHSTGSGSFLTSETYIAKTAATINNLQDWVPVIRRVIKFTVCLTTFFSAVKGGLIGPSGFTSRLDRNADPTGTGMGDDLHQRTAGFTFFLGHFGTPTDLKHMTVYGQENKFDVWRRNMERDHAYAQRRYVCLDADLDLYRQGLVMIHDAVWPRHLLKNLTRNSPWGNVSIEPYFEDVNTQIKYNIDSFKQKIDPNSREGEIRYDPHTIKTNQQYIRAESLRVSCQNTGQTIEIRPLDSVVRGSHCRMAIALEMVKFANLLGLQPTKFQQPKDFLDFLNYWIRPQVMIPGKIPLPGCYDDVDIWKILSGNGDVEKAKKFLYTFYKMVDGRWKRMLSLSSRLDKNGTYDKGRLNPKTGAKNRAHSSDGFRKFGWPKDKYERMDVRTIMEPMYKKGPLATGKRSEYRGVWNGLPELAAFSASEGKEITLKRSDVKPNTIIVPYKKIGQQGMNFSWDNGVKNVQK